MNPSSRHFLHNRPPTKTTPKQPGRRKDKEGYGERFESRRLQEAPAKKSHPSIPGPSARDFVRTTKRPQRQQKEEGEAKQRGRQVPKGKGKSK